ncbi:hypothetical protein BH09VER1_BH09VER1_51650 [soil metagenome]
MRTAVHATEIYQEGLCIPLPKLYEKGVANETVFKIIEKNVRVPKKVLGDLHAQLAACNSGEQNFHQLFAKHGSAAVRRYCDALQKYAERMMRNEITDIPDGTYELTDYIDGLGENPEPIQFRVKV